MSVQQKLNENIRRVYDRVAQVCQAVGRDAESVKVVAVSKYADAPLTRLLAEQLQVCFPGQPIMLGENRPQVLQEKIAQWADGPQVQWHFIGPLQSNKISKVVGAASLLHSLDRLDLLLKLQRYAVEHEIHVDGLLEFNVSGESAKHGWEESQLDSLFQVAPQLSHLRLRGLMGMSGLDSSDQQRQQEFQRLAELLPVVQAGLPSEQQSHFCELSMGMSGDSELAIAAGSTMLRIGSAFWDGVLF